MARMLPVVRLLFILLLACPAALADTIYFPQVADGGGYSTTFTILNTTASRVSGTLRLYNQNGTPRALAIGGGTPNSQFPITIGPNGSARITTPNSGAAIVSGWALFESTPALEGVATFEQRGSDGLLFTTAAVVATEPVARAVIPVETSRSGSTTAGLAIANIQTTAVTVALRLYNEAGVEIERTLYDVLNPLGAGYQIAELLTTLFPVVAGTDFKGTVAVEVVGSARVVVTGLGIREGLLSAVPVIATAASNWQPALTSILPSSATAGQTVTVALEGANFIRGATTVRVSGAGISVGTPELTGYTSLTVALTVAASAAVGNRTVTVSTPGGTSNSVVFTVNAPVIPPTLTSIAPASGTAGSTVSIALGGTNFVAAATTVQVSGSGVTVGTPQVSSSTSLSVTLTIASTAAAGTRSVTVTTASGTSNSLVFTVTAPVIAPTLTSIVPSGGTPGSIVPVTLTGTNFVSGATTVGVSGTGIAVSAVQVNGSSSLSATFTIASTAASGNRSVTVTTNGGTSNAVSFTISSPATVPAPTLSAIVPSSGNPGQTVTATLTGTNFIVGGTTVQVSGTGVLAGSTQVNSATSLTVALTISSTATAGAYTIAVTTSGGTSNGVNFTVSLPSLAPTLTSIAPSSAVAGSTVQVTLTGTNFVAGGTTVQVGGSGVSAGLAEVSSSTSLTVSLTVASTATGTREITVTTSAGTSNALIFSITAVSGEVEAAWIARYTRGGGVGAVNDVVLDQSGNVYVLGSRATVKYGPNGNLLWEGPAANVRDTAGNLYVGETRRGVDPLDSSREVAVAVKYDNQGTQLWTARYRRDSDGDGFDDAGYCERNGIFGVRNEMASAITVDAQGNVILTSDSSCSVDKVSDYFTIKFDGAGNQVWRQAAVYNGPASGYDRPSFVTSDATGNIYVTGVSQGANNGWATVKYASSGNQMWVARYEHAAHFGAWLDALAVDANGNVYVAGYSADAASSLKVTIKYDSGGVQRWVARFDTGGSTRNTNAFAVDSIGNVYIAGITAMGASNSGFLTIKYDSLGNELWVRTINFGFIVGGASAAADLAVDASGNIYVVGSGNDTFRAIKYGASGNLIWTFRTPAARGFAPRVALDAAGNLYFSGYLLNNLSAPVETLTIKIAP